MRVRALLRGSLIAVVLIGAGLSAAFSIGRLLISRRETVDWSALAPASGATFLQTRSGRVHVLDIGTGPTVLLMHGSGRGLVDWRQGTAEGLALHHRVVAFDYYGNGSSERNSAFTYGYDLWVQQAVDVLDALGIDHVTVVGQSVGGGLACILAADHPSRVDHVVTIGTGLTIEPQQFLPFIPGVGELMFANLDSFGETYSSAHRAELEASFRVRGTRAAILQYIRRQMTVDGLRLLRGVFEEIKVPVLHLSGDLDKHISPDTARALTNRTHGTFVLIEGAGHNLHIEAPQRTVEEIERFLRSDQILS